MLETVPPSLSPNNINCADCSTQADCVQNNCICRPGFEGDGYECNSLCEEDEWWTHKGCSKLTSTPSSEVADDSEEFGKRLERFSNFNAYN